MKALDQRPVPAAVLVSGIKTSDDQNKFIIDSRVGSKRAVFSLSNSLHIYRNVENFSIGTTLGGHPSPVRAGLGGRGEHFTA